MTNQANLRYLVESYEGVVNPEFVTALRTIAGSMVEASRRVRENQKVLLWFDNGPGVQLVKELELRCLAKGAKVHLFMRDLEDDARIVSRLDTDQVAEYFRGEKEAIDKADVVLIVRGPKNPQAMQSVPFKLKQAYSAEYERAHQKRIDGSVAWTLLVWPTEFDAVQEGMAYEDYFNVFLEACNQPWEEIRIAQALLKDMLDKGKNLEFRVNEDDPDPKKRTRVTMSIEGMTFANSTIARNIPGSEVFSAPIVDSVNGHIFAPGRYMYDGRMMEDIYLRIENGMIAEASAKKGGDDLEEILNQALPVSRRFGEVALGTNPGLARRYFNSLLNEKVSGSFHMAIGHCYTYTEYDGEPVKVNNGNIQEGAPHWDLSILMHRSKDGSGGGIVLLDGEVISKDGFFIDARLAILNPKKK